MKKFEEIRVGDCAEFCVLVDENTHNEFSRLSGDRSPIHTDDEFSKNTQFKKKIGYAFLLTSFLSRLYGEHLPGGSSVCIKQEANFLKPFYIGDEIKIKAIVEKKIESTRFVEIKTEMFRDKDCIFRGKGIVQVRFDG